MSPPFQSALQTPGAQLARPDVRYPPVRHLGASEAGAPGARPSQASPVQRRAYTDDIDLDTDMPATEPPDSGGDDAVHTILVEARDQGAASRPRHLCYIRDPALDEYETINVSQFLDQEGDDVDMEFVFVSYTREQFRVATDEEIDAYAGYPDEATREANRQLAHNDRATLVGWGLDAARRAGKRAFWIDFECVRDRDGVARTSSKSDDVYRICDVVRAAHSMIIAISPPASDKVAALLRTDRQASGAEPQATTKWLRHWGSRLWTLPELLLCPGEHRVQLYALGSGSGPVAALAKRNFAERAWDDAALVQELLHHYEGSAILSGMRLLETALACFARRGTHSFSPGDVAYALMGLLPTGQRPVVHPGDSGFEAFARLSLASDAGAFLSRMVCLLPPPPQHHYDVAPAWYENVKDTWGARVRDVHPNSRVVGIAADVRDTLLLDGVPGAAVRWDAFDDDTARQAELAAPSKTLISLLIASGGLGLGAAAVLCLAANVSEGGHDIFGGSVLPGVIMVGVLFGAPALLAPALYLFHQRGGGHTRRQKHAQAQLVGVEGRVAAGVVERHLWGRDNGLLTLIDADADAGSGSATCQRKMFEFTLVDTHMMMVTHIRAQKPPVAAFAVGAAAHQQRLLLCSYDARDDTFVRETVVRVDNAMVDQMRRVDRARLRLHAAAAWPPGEEVPVTAARDSVGRWQQELLFIFLTLVNPSSFFSPCRV